MKINLKRNIWPYISIIFIAVLFQNCTPGFQSSSFSSLDSRSTGSGTQNPGTTTPPVIDPTTPPITNKPTEIINCDAPPVVEKTQISRLTRKQIYLTLTDIIGHNTESDIQILPPDYLSNNGLKNDGKAQVYNKIDSSKYFAFFEKVVDAAIVRREGKIFVCNINQASCLNKIIDDFSYLAHRGQSTANFITNLKSATAKWTGANEKLKWSLMTILMAPEFIYHQSSIENSTTQKLNDFKVAERLAFLLWYSAPDKELLDAAKNKSLQNSVELEKQVDRLIANNRFGRFTYNFVEQWLSLPEAQVMFTERASLSNSLVTDLINEPRRLFDYVVKNNLPVDELMTADYSILTKQTADYYGLNSANLSAQAQKVSSPGRRGVFTHAATIAGMTNDDKTNPTHRGYWFLKRSFCVPPDPLPASVDPNSFQPDPTLPIKERLASLTRRNACAGCHKQMDPIGLAFESFGIFGKYRTKSGPHPVDPSGQLVIGKDFTSTTDMIDKMNESSQYDFQSCFAHHIISSARASSLRKLDLCSTRKLVTTKKMTFTEIIKQIVKSDLFLK